MSSLTSRVSTFQVQERPSKTSSSVVEILAVVGSIIVVVLTFPVSLFFIFEMVPEYERAIVFRLGHLRSGGARGPGLFFTLPCIDMVHIVDLRTVSFNVPCQEVLTKDGVVISVDAVVFLCVIDPHNVVLNIADYNSSTSTLAATSLRNVMATYNLSEILTQRESLGQTVQRNLEAATQFWGVKIELVEIKDIGVPAQMQRSMAAEVEATREARAQLIAAEGELKASHALKEAAKVISENPAALQLRYLQTLTAATADLKSTILFPLPMNFVPVVPH